MTSQNHFVPPAGTEDQLSRTKALYDSAQTRWNHIDWPFVAYETHLRIVSGVDRANACDLYLSGAAGLRVESAWVTLQSWTKPRVLRILAGYRLRDCDPEDIWGDVIVRLSKQDLVFPTADFQRIGFSETPAAIVRFDGRCKLENYVLLIAKRLAFDEIKRYETKINGLQYLASTTETAAPSGTNESVLLKDPVVVSSLSAKLSKVLASLSAEDRALCAMVYSGHLTRRQAANFLGWSDPSKATRRLQRIGELLARALHGVIHEGVGSLSPAQASDVLALLLRHLQFQSVAQSIDEESGSETRNRTLLQECTHESNR